MHFCSECGDLLWTDCISEDEKYLRKTKFYEECDTPISSGNNNPLVAVSSNTCFANRNCENGQLSGGDEPYVGYAPNNECTCPVEKYTAPSSYTSPGKRLRRQSGERFATKTKLGACRKQCARAKKICSKRSKRCKKQKRRCRKTCDSAILIRVHGYDDSIKCARLNCANQNQELTSFTKGDLAETGLGR